MIDTVSEFRAEAENPILVSWANDFHTGSTGRQIAASKLAERLQRYGWAREIYDNRQHWTPELKERTGASFPQRITTVNRMFTSIRKTEVQDGQKHWKVKHPAKVAVLVDGAPDVSDDLANFSFQYLNLKYTGPKGVDYRRTELVSIGDSQLHSAVYGSGMPAFINAEVGGRFRWGSKSWSGFSPPEIYREVVPDKAIQPRVVVLTFLPKYFWHSYHTRGDQRGQINEEANKYKPRPLPPLKRRDAAQADQDAAPTAPFKATIKVTQTSKQRDPRTLSYDEAIAHTAAVVTEGPKPLIGQTVGVRFWTMADRELIEKAGAVKPGDTFTVTLHDWMAVIDAAPKLAEHMVYDDTDLDLAVPVFWVTEGPLSGKAFGVKAGQ